MGGLKINSVYKPLYTSKKRYFLITGGRGSLKSSSVHDFISRLTFEEGHGILFTRYTMTSAEKSIIPEFKETLKRNNTERFFYITKNKITNLATGSFILFSGIKTSSGDQTANLKSISGITTLVVEEGEDFNDEKAFDTIDDSIRGIDKQNRVIWIQNPSTREHFIYEKWIEKTSKHIEIEGYKVTVSDHPDVEHIHTTFRIAEEMNYLSDSWLNKAENLKINNPKKYYHTYIGGWLEKAEGVILENWVKGKFDESLPYGFGLDWGSKDPFTLTKFAVDKKNMQIYIKNYVYKANLNTADIKELVGKYVTNNEVIIADSANRTGIFDLKSWGFNAYPSYKGTVAGRLRDLQQFQLVIDDSPEVEKELNNYCWLDKRGEHPIDDHNHIIDPLGYYYLYVKRM